MTGDEGVLRFAREEIISLRRRNEILEARDEVVRLFTTLVMPRPQQGMGEDVVWLLDARLREIELAKLETIEREEP